MSQYPALPPNQPPAGLSYGYALYPSPRPGVVTGLSITAIVLGCIGILCNGLGLVLQLIAIAAGGRNAILPTVPVMNDPALRLFGAASTSISLFLSIALLIGGIGGLKLWAPVRSAMIKWSIVTILWATFSYIMQIVWVLPTTRDFVLNQQARNGKSFPPGMATGFTVGQIFGSGVVWLLWCVLPILFLSYWRSDRVKSAFNSTTDSPPQPGVWTP